MKFMAARMLAFLFPALLFSAPARPQEEEEEEQELFEEEFELLQQEETVVSASRHQQKKSQSPVAITVIGRRQIEAAGAFSIPDLLRRVPGLEVVTNTPAFPSVNARLPTTYENHLFLVLVDGRQTNMELWGQAPWELQPISLDDIERIEIIRGPASALYGSNAFAGVINIYTRAVPEKSTAWIEMEGGTWGRARADGRASYRSGDLGVSLGAGYDTANDFGDMSTMGKRTWRARGLAEYRLGQERRLSLDFGASSLQGIASTSIGAIRGGVTQLALRLAWEEPRLRAQLNYSLQDADITLSVPIYFGKLHLADFPDLPALGHDADGEVQWTLPELWQPLLLVAGARVRASWLECANCLDAESFSDPTSPGYHLPGMEYFELRAGGFLHAELSPTSWLALNASGRADYNTETGFFLSPRLAAVFFTEEHSLRLSATRAFRKPSFLERRLHPQVTFPAESPIQGGDKILFLEFMTRVVGNEALGDEKLWAFEAGYQWHGREGKIEAGLSAYANMYSDSSSVTPHILIDQRGLPDLRESRVQYEKEPDFFIAGLEASLRIAPCDWLTLRAAWTWREVWDRKTWASFSHTPKNIYSLGGEILHPDGWVGSLMVFGRSEFLDTGVPNPAGIMGEMLSQRVPNTLLAMGRAGFRFRFGAGRLESGLKFLLPFSWQEPHFRAYEHGGGITPEGVHYGGSELWPTLLMYLSGEI